ncbi:MAG: hypothetical protein CM1200mP35_01710 [Chloroflexota bacterium]|nr:MAG: hypothetical protein CM1200mP35_01710 [Chloroflexota bacterium]
MLAKSWEVSDDGLIWTFHLNEGVQFHKGYGEMTAEDVIWSFQQLGTSEKHPRASNIRGVWLNENGSVEAPDPYTVVLNTGDPWSQVPIHEMLTSPGGSGTWVASKKQTDEIGEEEANGQISATGPWDLVGARTGEFWGCWQLKTTGGRPALCRDGVLGDPGGILSYSRIADGTVGHYPDSF